ncbi:MAG: hypothetical protein HQL24_01040 [Candidatus Omnitrophica bacterium]|nr:hypothetical protein [Candidatus Omnitrophota bacterium]
MSPSLKTTLEEKNLIRRYLIWCYKTTKESLDRIDRYYTQLKADDFILKELKAGQDFKKEESNPAYKTLVKGFEDYMAQKKINVDQKKYSECDLKNLHPDYLYLKNRCSAIQNAIVHFLGKKELKAIQQLYEQEMTQRILQSREHT